jgi:DNA-directed RNA polymerase beta' subunit
MNIHIAQSEQARNELKRLANVKLQIIGCKDSNPLIGCVQDTVAGAYMLTLPDNVYMTGTEASNLLCNTTSETKFNIDKNKRYNGHEIFSHIIPKGINITKIKDGKIELEIVDGELISGKLNKSSLSMVKNSIIHFIWDKYGPNKTRKFIDDSQRLILNFLMSKGLTFSFGDCYVQNDEVEDQINKLISNKILEYNISLTQYENDTDQLDASVVEKLLAADLNNFATDIGQILSKFLDNTNNLFLLIDGQSGAKGSLMNLQHIMGCLGQRSVEGQRIKKRIENRCLPIFHRDDDTPEARGFIKSSFSKGLDDYEYFYDAMASREGLIDTAIKSVTWETPIIIIENGEPKYTEIGKWIDNLLDNNKEKIQHSEERQMELLDTNNIYIPTTDYKGNVTWGSVSAVTRHDPGTELYEIKTNGGRSVIVTESKSLLVWNNKTGEFKEMLTPDIKVGDCVPVTAELTEPPVLLNYKDYNLQNILTDLENDCFPDNLYIAPKEFIKDILQVYFSKFANIENECISIKLKNKKLSNGISMLCSRFGIYGSINNNIFKISDEYDIKFREHIFSNAMHDIAHRANFKTLNNVVLDEIVEINLIDVSRHPKVYDLTIPSTFNFGLANGLQVRDTAKTGYIQRQIIKALEDISIKYDNTNRNSKNIIIQYIYGENGIEQSSQTQLTISMIEMNNEQITSNFGFDKNELKKLGKKYKNLEKFNKKYIEKIKNYRDELRRIQTIATFNTRTLESKYMLPVNLFRLTQDYTNKNKKETFDLSPEEIDESINELLNSKSMRLITGLKDEHPNLLNDDRAIKYLLEIAIHDYICPKKCIFKYGLDKKDFHNLLTDIKNSFIKALVQPGEMVGIIAAQSIGEPTSQMSMCFHQKNKLIIKNKKTNKISMISPEIGEFCDKIIKNNPDVTCGTGHVNSVETELDTLENEYYIIGVDAQEKTHWNKISHVSRHPVNGDMMKVTTKSGRIVHTTTSHSHLIRKDQTVVPIVGADMTVGMRIPVAKHIDNTFIKDYVKIDKIKYDLDYSFGWFMGAYLAEGSFNGNVISISNISEHFINNTTEFAKRFNKKTNVRNYQGEYGPSTSTSFNCKELKTFILDTCGTGSFVKCVPDFAFTAPNEFKAGLIQAYVDGDGNFQADETRNQIRVCSRSEQLIKDIALLLSYFDMFGSIKPQFVKGSNIYNLAMSARYSVLYKEHIGSLLHSDKLDKIVEYATREDAHNLADDIDKINGLGEIIAKCGKELNLPGQSRNYGRWKKKETIGRRTLEKYIQIFETHEDSNKIEEELLILKQAANSHVIWDEVKEIEIYTPDQSVYVYDFTVPANQTFMTDYGVIVHNTLNTKHSSGVASKRQAISGVPRIEELLHYSKNIKTPEMIVYFNDNISNNKPDINKVVSYFKYLSINELVSKVQIYYDIGTNEIVNNDNVQNPFFVNNQKAELSSLQFLIRLELDIEKMHDKETTLLDIKTKFISHWYKYFNNHKNLKKNEKEIFTKISRCAILSNENNIIHIRFNMNKFNYNIIIEFLKIILEQVTLKGLDNITNISIDHERKIIYEDDGNVKDIKEYVVYTSGINMEKIKYLKGINMARTRCNDTAVIYRLYGVEAARCCLLNELKSTFEAGGSTINYNHMSVLIDMMTHLGIVISVDRHGLNKVESEPLARASFEKTMEHFTNAAIFNEKDNINSVSSRIMIGKVINGGTGAFDILLDTNKLENSEYTKDESGGRIIFTGLLEEDTLLLDVVKNDIVYDFFVPK